MLEAETLEGQFGFRRALWTFLTFVVPLGVAAVTATMGTGAFFWGLLFALSMFGVLLPLSLIDAI